MCFRGNVWREEASIFHWKLIFLQKNATWIATLHAKTLVVENRSKLVNQNSPLILSFQQTKTISKLLSLEIYKLEDELSFILIKETRSRRCLFDARIRSKAWHNSRATTLTIKVTNSLFLLIIHDVHLFKRRRKKINSVRQRERDKT